MRFRLCPVLLLCLCLVPLAAHADAVVKIMPLGDSITRGGPGADTTYPSYRYYLDESLRASGYGVDFVGSGSSAYGRFVFDQQHDGHGGYTTGMMVGTSSFSPLAAWLAASPTPEIVLLHVGTNDAINGVPLATRLANVKQIVTLLRQKNPKVRVMVAKIIPTGDATRNAQQIAPYNAGLPGLAAEVSTTSSPVTVVDLYAGYDGVADNQPDGIHPKTTGERKMAGAWQRALAPILSATPTPTTKAPTTVPTTALTTGMPSGRSIPGTLEAENYNPGGEGVGYHDATPTNQGGAYRADAVDIEAITGGGYTVGYVRDGEWLQYTVNVASAGTYAAAFRVASWGTAAHAIEVQVNGNPAATVAVPSTGSYDAWTTATATLSLPAGTCSLKLRFVGDGQNLDRVVFAPIAVTTAPTTVPTTVAPTLSGRRVPGTIEAEDYNAGGEGVGYHDTTPGNHDNVYRHDGVDLSVNPSGGYNVGYVVDGEWLAYTLAVPSAGTYTVSCSVASWADGRSLALALDGASLGTLAVPNNLCSGWRTVSRQVALPAGTHRLVVRFVGDKQILDRVAVAAVATPTTTVPTTKPPTTVPTTPVPTSKANAVPGTLEAEDYAAGGEGVGYHDVTPTNQGGAYRADAVDIEALAGGGYTVGYVRDGEWLRYSVPVAAAGQYRAAFRVAAWGTAAHAIEVQVNGNPAATVAVPSTGSYDAWTTATATLSLPAGTCSLRLRFVGDGQNLDRVVFAPIAVTTAPTTVPTTVAPTLSGRRVPGTIEAEDYNAGGEGVGYHDTTPGNHDNVYRHDGVDLSVNPSGGYNVGYVVDGEWLAYTLAVPSAGTYTVSCTVASWADGRSLALALDGASLGTLAVPNNLCSGWRTVSRQVALPAGTHRLVVRFVGDKQILDRVAVAAVATPTTVPTTPGGTVRLPATIQAENYATGGEGVGYHDTTAGNQGGKYRQDGVDIAYAPSIASYVVTQIRAGEWLEYSVDAPVERDYPLTFRLSSPSGGQFLEMTIDGRSEVTVIAPRTGSYDAYATISTQVRLTKGTHRVRVQFFGDGQNFDAFGLS